MEVLGLEQAQARLNALDRERAVLARQIATMRLAAGGPDIGTAAGRVALFQSLFRGRTDVFATRWQSAQHFRCDPLQRDTKSLNRSDL